MIVASNLGCNYLWLGGESLSQTQFPKTFQDKCSYVFVMLINTCLHFSIDVVLVNIMNMWFHFWVEMVYVNTNDINFDLVIHMNG